MNQLGKKILLVTIFAIAMAYFESAVVVYLREVYNIKDLIRDVPEKIDYFTFIELGRELSTLVMLLVIGLITGKKWKDKLGYFIITFGIWDIFYYVWLKIFIGWPNSLLEWDILFLIPLPWWGPVLSPILISILMIIFGWLIVRKADEEGKLQFTFFSTALIIAGILLMLYTLMDPGLSALIENINEITKARPVKFNWFVFFAGYICVIISIFKVIKIHSIKTS
jgi:hypothetical protein